MRTNTPKHSEEDEPTSTRVLNAAQFFFVPHSLFRLPVTFPEPLDPPPCRCDPGPKCFSPCAHSAGASRFGPRKPHTPTAGPQNEPFLWKLHFRSAINASHAKIRPAVPLLSLCAATFSFAAETWLNRNRYSRSVAFRGISARTRGQLKAKTQSTKLLHFSFFRRYCQKKSKIQQHTIINTVANHSTLRSPRFVFLGPRQLRSG